MIMVKKNNKIVGIINDSRYVSDLERGTNSLGDGNNSGFYSCFKSRK